MLPALAMSSPVVRNHTFVDAHHGLGHHRRVRISFVLPLADLSGGVRTIAIHVRNLRARGHQVTVVSNTHWAPPLRRRIKSLLLGRGWPGAPVPEPGHFEDMGLDHTRLPRYRPVVDADLPEADAVIATWWTTAEWVAALAPSRGTKFHLVQDHEIWGGDRRRVDAAFSLPLRKIVVSSWLDEVMRREYGQAPVATVRNAVDPAEFDAPPRHKQPTFTVGLTYATKPNKGTDVALRAFDLAARDVPGLRLVSMGNEPVLDTLPLPAGADFTLRARGPQVRELYARCDAWLFPSRWEGFGLPVLEAMACRTPVIGTPAGAARELIGEGGGVLVPVGDAGAMAAAIRDLAALDDAAWRALSDQARATATSYGWDDATTALERALEAGLGC
jgi:glycosyltransferase involved in cell wall biosynthesis